MHIGIDIRVLQRQDSRYRGTALYTREFIQSLFNIDKVNNYTLFGYKENFPYDLLKLSPNAGYVFIKEARRFKSIQDQLFYPLEVSEKKLDLFHVPEINIPFFYSGKKVITVYDLIPKIYPVYLKTTKAKIWYTLQLKALRRIDKIIAISYSTKRDLCKILSIPEEKIKVIYPALPSYLNSYQVDNFDKVKNKFNINRPYLFYVGGFDKRKNIPFLLSVFKRLIKEKNLDLFLVIGGDYSWSQDNLLRLLEDLGIKNRVTLTGWLKNEELASLYKNASVFVFPSLYEGFGFPVLEAMACRVPVVASNISSMQEIIGDAGILVSPNDESGFIEGIENILKDNQLCQEYIKRSQERVKIFSWQNTAKEILTLYNEVLMETN